MFTFSKNREVITGTINGEIFGINYTEDVFKAMSELENKLEAATTPAEAVAITEEFRLLTEENHQDSRNVSFHSDIYVANTGKYYLKVGQKITAVPMPEALIDRIKDSVDKGIDVTPLIKFWIRFLRNHKLRNICVTPEDRELFAARVFNYVDMDFINFEKVEQLVDEKGYDEQVAIELATVKQVKISKEGLLQTFKVSKEITKRYRLNDKNEREEYDIYTPTVTGIDPITGLYIYDDVAKPINEDRVFQPAVQGTRGDAFFCGGAEGHIIKVGEVHRLKDWSMVNTNDNASCVKGLHIGGLSYIKGYQTEGTETHNILVDPAHIGAVPDDRTGAIRCLQYFVLDAFSGVNGSLYHSSSYGKLTDGQWDEEKAAILKEFGELQQQRADSLTSLLP